MIEGALKDRDSPPSIGRAIPIESVLSVHPFKVRRRIAFRDCDPAGIVYTPRFFDPIMTSAADLFLIELIGPHWDRDPGFETLGTPAKAIEIVFHRPVGLGAMIDLFVTCKTVSNRTMTLSIESQDLSGELLFCASLTLICIDNRSFTAIAVPGELRERLEPHMTPPDKRAG